MSGARWLSLSLLPLLGCASQMGPQPATERAAGVRGLGRPPGMAIGTGGAPASPDVPALELPAELRSRQVLVSSQLPASPPPSSAEMVPCSGCVELQLDVNDINQRDEFGIALNDLRVQRVVWTVLVNFNSDQLAVQPFVDGVYGKYSSLHVNTFPLGTAVELVQELEAPRKARHVGLKVGSSGAWTGEQTMSVFISELRVEGSRTLHAPFDAGPDGLQARTHSRNPRVVFHPPQPASAAAGAAAQELAR